MRRHRLKNLTLFLFFIALMSCACSLPLFCADQASDEALEMERNLLINAFQNYLNKHVKKMPLILFPESKVGYLKNLREIMAENYFVVPEVRNATFSKREKKYRIDQDIYDNVEFTFSQFLVKGMPIDSATFSFKSLVLDQEKLKKKEFFINSANAGNFTLEVTAEDLGKFISQEAEKHGTIMPGMSTEGESILLQGNMKFMDYQGEVFVKGNSYVDKSNLLRFRILKCITGKNSVPGFIVDTISNMVNPLMLFEKFMFDLTTREILIRGNKIFLVAEARQFLKKVYEINYRNKELLKYINK